MAVTMADVAKRAGVSKATVSRVLNDVEGHASVETIARVHKAVEDLGYLPNRMAANLKKRDAMSVGLVVADIVNPFFAQIAQGVEDTLQPTRYSLILANTGNAAERELMQIRMLMEQQVDAIILASSFHDGAQQFEDALQRDIKIVLVNNLISEVALDAVVVDNFGGAYQATSHLIALGHRDIAIVTGPERVYSSKQRLRGYMQALAEAGIEPQSDLILEGDFGAVSGYECTEAIIQRRRMPSALFVINNLMAMGSLKALSDYGFRIPDEISFVGFDDMDWYQLVTPPITAVRQPSYRIGAIAATRLLERLSLDGVEASTPEVTMLDTELIIRESTASAAPAAEGRQEV